MVLLDVMMPRMDGLEVCRRIHKAGNTPVMMLTAKGETFDKVLGLELGADDYMVKPFDTRLLSPILSRSESLCNCFPTVPTCVRLKWNWRKHSTQPMRPVPPSIPILPSREFLDGLITAVA